MLASCARGYNRRVKDAEKAGGGFILQKSEQSTFLIRHRYESNKSLVKIMKNLTPEQKKMEREYARMESVIASASKGQQSLRPRGSNGEYSQFQQECYATYQAQIQAAQTRINQLKEVAREILAKDDEAEDGFVEVELVEPSV